MRPEVPAAHLYRFGLFEADARDGRLLRRGARVNIQEQPFQVLLVLLRRAGEVVTREELRRELWPSDTYVEFDGSLNAALKKLRHALGDSADNPSFIETVTKRGYRFIAPVEVGYPERARSKAPAAGGVESAPTDGSEVSVRGGLSLARAPEARAPEPVLVRFPVQRTAQWRPRVALSAITLPIATLLCAAVYWWLPAPQPRVLRRVQLTRFGRADSASGMATDGSRIFFSEVKGGRYSVDQVSVSGGEPAPFPLPFPNAEVFDISPDRTELLIASFMGLESDEVLWVVPVTGGPPRRLGDAAGTSGAWSPDGHTIAYTRGSDVWAVSRDGNEPRRLVTSSVGLTGRVRWSPSGRTLRFTVEKTGTLIVSLWEVAADGSNLRPLAAKPETLAGTGEAYGSWTPDGRYFVYRSFDGAEWGISARREAGSFFRRLNRQPVQLYAGPHLFYVPSLSVDGKRVFFIEEHGRGELARYDSASRHFVTYLGGISARYVDFSSDGQRLAYIALPDYQIWSSRVSGSEGHPLTFPPMLASSAHFSPNSQQIGFGAWGPGVQSGIYVVPTEVGGKLERVMESDKGDGGLMGWSQDGQALLFWQAAGQESRLGLYAFSLKTRKVTYLAGSEGLHHGSVSPNRLLVAALNEDNRSIVLYDLLTHQKTELAKGAAVVDPYWAHDGRSVFFQDVREGSDQPIYRVRLDDHKVERVINLAQPLAADVTSYRLTGITPDDQVLALLNRSNSDLYALDVDFP